MFKTADVHSMWRVFSALSVVSLVMLLGACTHAPTTAASEPKNWVVENVGSKSTAELYTDLIAPALFELSSSKVINTYTVQSGNLLESGRSVGSLVTVRGIDGSLTAIVALPEKQGVLRVNSDGKSYFILEKYPESLMDDAIVPVNEPHTKSSTSKPDTNEAKVIDVFAGFSRAYAERVGDPLAFALAEMETVNQALRNSLVANVAVRLVGIQIVEEDHLASVETLGKLQTIFSSGIGTFQPDVVAGFFNPEGGPALGWGYVGGRSSVNAASLTFRHEIGHNASGSHCTPDDPAKGYGFGYKRSIMCGAWYEAFYSTPLVLDENGSPRGHALTADMARVWRENAARLSSYAPPPTPPTAPGNFAKVGSTANTITFSWSPSPKAVRYEIFSAKTIGSPIPKKIGGSIGSTFTATNISGEALYFVKAVSLIDMVSVPSNTVVTRP